MKLRCEGDGHRSESVVKDSIAHSGRGKAKQLVISVDGRVLYVILLLLNPCVTIIVAYSIREWIVVLTGIAFKRRCLAVYRVRTIVGRVFTSTHYQPKNSNHGKHHVALTYPIKVSASKLEAWSRLSKGSSGIDKASVDAMFDSDIGGAAI